MRKNEFFKYVEDHILEAMGPEYQNAAVEIRPVTKSNDVVMHGLMVARENETVVPVVYLESFYEQYQKGMDLDSVMHEISDVRISNAQMPFGIEIKDITDFDKMKDFIRVKICDPELNKERLEGLVSKDYGDFTATYMVALPGGGPDSQGSIAVNDKLLDSWGITPEQLNEVALRNDMNAFPCLNTMESLMESMVFGAGEPINYLHADEAFDMESIEIPMFCLTNGDKSYGASLIVNPEVQQRIAKVVDGDYYVLPSSQHEVLIIPENADISLDEMSDMVKSVNETEVSPQDLLSDKVQHYSAYAKVMENARDYENKVKEQPELYGKTKDDPGKNEPLPSHPII